MRPEGSPLDLNNLPEDYTRDGKEASEDSSSSAVTGGYRRKKSGSNKEDDADKVYECRFCSLKFCKSQALGGHMNRHRQERETETLNKARQLVFTNDLAPTHLGYMSSGQPIPPGAFHHQPRNNISDHPSLPPLRSIYTTTRMFPNNTSPLSTPPPHQPFVYPTTHPPHLLPYSSQYQPVPPTTPQVSDGPNYFIGHALNEDSNNNTNSFMCIGAPVGPGIINNNDSNCGVRDVLMQNQDEGLNWGRR